MLKKYLTNVTVSAGIVLLKSMVHMYIALLAIAMSVVPYLLLTAGAMMLLSVTNMSMPFWHVFLVVVGVHKIGKFVLKRISKEEKTSK